jgi:hypothetical protein
MKLLLVSSRVCYALKNIKDVKVQPWNITDLNNATLLDLAAYERFA